MPSCCIKQCNARKRNNQPTLTFHRFPTSEIMKKKWLEIIGSENIKPRVKSMFVCSMHFDETSFNRTLDIVRLREGTVPSSSLLNQHTESTLKLTLNSQPSTSAMVLLKKKRKKSSTSDYRSPLLDIGLQKFTPKTA